MFGEGGSGFAGMIIVYAVIIGIFIFMTSRQRKEKKQVEAMLSTIETGDSVITTSGFYGVVLDVMDDIVIVEFGNNKNCRIPMQRQAIASVEKAEN